MRASRHGACNVPAMPRPSRSLKHLIDEIAYRAVLAVLCGSGCVLVVSALYLTKSAMGIDLMEGPSPFHEYFLN
jgi:hypothetical protein